MIFAGWNISKRFAGGAVEALAGVSVSVNPGEAHLILGENGAGKSTLFNILAGDIPADTGLFAYSEGAGGTTPPGRFLRLTYVRQEPRYDPRLRVWEHLLLGYEERPVLGSISPRAAARRLEKAGLSSNLGIQPENRMSTLSPGERYLLSLIAGLSIEPEVVILDEPFAPCTGREAEILKGIIASLREQNAAVLLASHRIREALDIADTVTVLRGGVATLTSPRGGLTTTDVYDAMFEVRETELSETGPSASPRGAAEPVLRFGSLGIEDGQGRKVNFADLSVYPGERLGVLSKDPKLLRTAEDAISGFAPEGTHSLVLRGAQLRRPTPRRLRDSGFRYVPRSRDSRGLALSYSIDENLRIPLSPRDLSRARVDLGEEIEAPLGTGAPAATLSGGNRGRLVILRETSGDVSLLFMVRPSAGLDRRSLDRLSARLERRCREGVGVLLLSSDPEEVLALCSAVRVVSGGVLGNPIPTAGLTEGELMELLAR